MKTKTLLLIIMSLVGSGAIFLVLASCESESPTSYPLYGVGAIEGYVLLSGQGTSAEVRARAQEGFRSGDIIARTDSDSTGYYRLELPVGPYEMSVYARSLNVNLTPSHETVHVLPTMRRHDLEFGQAQVTIVFPTELDGQRFYLDLTDSYGNRVYTHSYTRVIDGLWQEELPMLALDSYTMRMDLPNLGGDVYLPGTPEPEAADSLVVIATGITEYRIDLSSQYASISGQVTGSWQEASLSRPLIQPYSDPETKLGNTQCSVEGFFTCDFIFPQEVRLMVEINGTGQWIGGNSFETAEIFDLQPGDRMDGISVIESGFEISLAGPTNYASNDGLALVFDASGNLVASKSFFDNSLTVNNLPPGNYYLNLDGHCYREIWQPQWYGGSDSMEGATLISLGEGEFQILEMTLVTGGSIHGSVEDFPGNWSPSPREIGVFDAQAVPLCSKYDGFRRFWEDEFDFIGLADGDYFLAVLQTNGPWWYPGTWDLGAAQPINIANSAAVSGISWYLPDYRKEAN